MRILICAKNDLAANFACNCLCRGLGDAELSIWLSDLTRTAELGDPNLATMRFFERDLPNRWIFPLLTAGPSRAEDAYRCWRWLSSCEPGSRPACLPDAAGRRRGGSGRMKDAGIRGHIFVAIVISVVIGIAAAGVAGYHVFERGLEAAYQARLRSLVDEAGRVLDAGIRAGLAIDQPQLMQKALAGETSADPIGPTEVVSIVDTRGIIIASTNSAEIGEAAPAAWSSTEAPPAAGPELLISSHEVMSLFGTVDGTIVARVPGEVMTARTTTFLFQLLVASTLVGGSTIVLAFLLVWLIPWPAVRRAEALRTMMDGLYDEVGGSGSAGPPGPLPRQIEEPAQRFRTTTLELYGHLLHERAEVSRLDEAA